MALILPVILTKVRIQGYARRRFWLWALTFVRVTKWGDEGVTKGAVDTGMTGAGVNG